MRATIVLSLILATATTGCNEPRYRNRTLSSWAYDLDQADDYKRSAGCEALATRDLIHVVAVDAAGNLSTPTRPSQVTATLRVGQETCLNTRQQTLLASAYAGRDLQAVSPGHLLAAGRVEGDPVPLEAADGIGLMTTGSAVDAAVATAAAVTTVNWPPAAGRCLAPSTGSRMAGPAK